MAIKASLFVALATMLVISTMEVHCEDPNIYYNYLNLIDKSRIGVTYHGDLMKALEELGVEDGEQPDAILERIKRVHSETPNDVYERLLSLAEKTDDCSPEMVNQIKYMLNSAGPGKYRLDEDEHSLVARFDGFIRHFGRDKFEMCAKRADRFMKLQGYIEPSLDEYFKEAMGITNENLNDEQLYERLKEFNLSENSLNGAGMLRMAQRTKTKKGEKDLALLMKLASTRCQPFKSELNVSHDILNLAKLLGSQESFSLKFIKMNEYRRLCLAIKRSEEKRMVMENFRKSMPRLEPKKSQGKGGFLRKLSCRHAANCDVVARTNSKSSSNSNKDCACNLDH